MSNPTQNRSFRRRSFQVIFWLSTEKLDHISGPTGHKIGDFGDVLSSQSLGLVLQN